MSVYWNSPLFIPGSYEISWPKQRPEIEQGRVTGASWYLAVRENLISQPWRVVSGMTKSLCPENNTHRRYLPLSSIDDALINWQIHKHLIDKILQCFIRLKCSALFLQLYEVLKSVFCRFVWSSLGLIEIGANRTERLLRKAESTGSILLPERTLCRQFQQVPRSQFPISQHHRLMFRQWRLV